MYSWHWYDVLADPCEGASPLVLELGVGARGHLPPLESGEGKGEISRA